MPTILDQCLDNDETVSSLETEVNARSFIKETIPFIMMSCHGDRDFVITAIQNGVSYYVVKPFTPDKLESSVREAWDGANKRNDSRHSGLPGHILKANFDGQTFAAQLSDLSHSGALINMTFNQSVQLFSKCELNLEFEEVDELGLVSISPLTGTVVRIEAQGEFHPSNVKCEVALCFATEPLDQKVEESLARLLTFLSAKEQTIVEDV